MDIYTVRTGDTISSIADKYGVSADLIIDTNFPPDTQRLAVGQDFVILIPQLEHIVSGGETLADIARRYGTTSYALLRANPKLAGRALYTGETIVIKYTDEPVRSAVTNGYAYTSIDRTLLVRALPYLTYLTIFTYGFTPNGELVYPNDDALIEAAVNYGAVPAMHLSTLTEYGGFSSELASNVLNNEAARENLINNTIENMRLKGYGALDVDFEFLPIEDRQKYVDFLEEFRIRLAPYGYTLLAALAPKTSTDQPGILYQSHDYAGIGAAVDYAFIMTYEWGYTYGPPLAVAPIQNVRSVLSYGITQIPPQKILMGIPLYGYDWRLPYVSGTRAQSLSPQAALSAAVKYNAVIEYDEAAQAPYFFYTSSDGNRHVVWFENAKSAAAKYDVLDDFGIAGAGFWNIDRFFPQNWLILNARYNIVRIGEA